MKTYLAVLRQAGQGCDYTIGCGVQVLQASGNSFEEAFEYLIKQLDWDGYRDHPEDYTGNILRDPEHFLESFEIYEIADRDCGEIYERFLTKVDERFRALEEQKQLEKERAEYLRLKEKFDG